MDTYNVKLRAMQQYVPFLDKMITKLEKVSSDENTLTLKVLIVYLLTSGPGPPTGSSIAKDEESSRHPHKSSQEAPNGDAAEMRRCPSETL